MSACNVMSIAHLLQGWVVNKGRKIRSGKRLRKRDIIHFVMTSRIGSRIEATDVEMKVTNIQLMGLYSTGLLGSSCRHGRRLLRLLLDLLLLLGCYSRHCLNKGVRLSQVNRLRMVWRTMEGGLRLGNDMLRGGRQRRIGRMRVSGWMLSGLLALEGVHRPASFRGSVCRVGIVCLRHHKS